ncbi:uncharacterized protein KGF55_004137 [Candida pseudojiufengensis]|uniref:uncharacterized protein n=1 Tax=Candida pseudojiufengensis TaxID=497109 RepID=UPI0022256397|nr:uncharacterized protein KGF55_004137 [Candida pseudojiufengensis]KAI5961212.1 hypothetical protein KGF55_004137 [Candida pseudojiufengensis]
MPIIKNLDDFIELSTNLLAIFPSTTTLSITYSNKSKKLKASKKPNSKPNKQQATHEVNIKLYEPHQGKLLKYKTKKQKELSKILNLLGPQGLSNQIGLTSLMTNVKYVEPETENIDESTTTVATEAVNKSYNNSKEGTPTVTGDVKPTTSKKKNKKKNKKK